VTNNSSGKNGWAMEGIWMFGQIKKAIKLKRDDERLMEEYKEHWKTILYNNKRHIVTTDDDESSGGRSHKSRRLGGFDWNTISSFASI
jgi:hypothetical protein